MYVSKIIKLLIVLAVNVLSFCSCGQEENKKITTDQNYQRLSQDTIGIRKCWINLDYFEYIHKSFPKKCEVNIDNPVLFLDSLKYSWTKCLKEYCIHKIQNNGKENYFTTLDSSIYNIEIVNNDTLLLNNKVYISNKNWDYWGFDFLSKVKGDIFKTKYETELKRIYNSIDTILLTYNPYWHIHFLKNENDCKNMYILEYDNDSISVYDFPNKCETLKKGWDKDKKLFTKWECVTF